MDEETIFFDNGNVTIYESDFDMIIADFAEKFSCKSVYDIPPTQWSAILSHINKRLIEPNKKELLKVDGCINNEYDSDKLINIYNIYTELCNRYIQCIDSNDFYRFSGINKMTRYRREGKLSTSGCDLDEKLRSDSEKSAISLSRMKGVNAVPYIAYLNKYHGWNGAGTTSRNSDKVALSAAELPKLGAPKTAGAIPEIVQDSGTIDD